MKSLGLRLRGDDEQRQGSVDSEMNPINSKLDRGELLMIRLAITAVMLLPLPTAASQRVAEVPSQFIGVWMGNPTSCDSERDDLALQLESKRIVYWESNGPIKAIVAHGRNEIALIAELSDEGESWLTTAQFKLSPAGDKLIDDTSIPGKEVVRYKCPELNGSRSSNSLAEPASRVDLIQALGRNDSSIRCRDSTLTF